MQTARALATLDDYLALTAEGPGELVEGELYMAPAPFFKHQRVVLRFSHLLESYFEKTNTGVVCIAPTDVVLTDRLVFQPDVLVMLKQGSRAELRDGRIYGPPDLCVEVISDSSATHDKIVKRDRYDRYGVREYWIADPAKRTIEVFRRPTDAASLEFAATYEVGDALTTPLLPGLSLTVGERVPRVVTLLMSVSTDDSYESLDARKLAL